jgi:hypothetical protein
LNKLQLLIKKKKKKKIKKKKKKKKKKKNRFLKIRFLLVLSERVLLVFKLVQIIDYSFILDKSYL